MSSKIDEDGKGLVTDVDRESQKLIAEVVAAQFPEHMLLGEEDAPQQEPPAKEFVWAVDPIDGTTNYVNGIPVHAISVAALHWGRPVAAAVWMPWPRMGGYTIFHGRLGGGAWRDKERLAVRQPATNGEPAPGRLSGVPLDLPFRYRIGKGFRRAYGEPRVYGSAAFDMCMVAAGIMEYSVTGPAWVWDFAAGSLLVAEAGGKILALSDTGEWNPFDRWGDPYSLDSETSRRIRAWRRTIICADPKTAQFIANNLKPRKPSLLHNVIRRLRNSKRIR